MLELNQVYQGDCLEVIQDIEDNSIDLTVTSPPYDNLRKYQGSGDQWGEHVWRGVIEQLYRVIKKGGIVVWIVGDATIDGSETGSSFKQALQAMECGFNLYDTMIWNKGGFSAVGALKIRYAPVFEYMFIWSKGKPKTFNPIRDRKTINGGRTASGTIRQVDGTTKPMSKKMTINEYGQRFNIWEQCPQRQKGGHPAPFPKQLAKDHIYSWSNEGDTVLDPFAGSGTTGAASRDLGRNFILIEKEPEYVEVCQERLNNKKELHTSAKEDENGRNEKDAGHH